MLSFFPLEIALAKGKGTLPGEDSLTVDFRNGLLKVSVRKQKFHEVLDEVAQKAGIRIVIDKSANEDLTLDFDYLPLEKGLKRLLRGRNYVFIYRSGEGVEFVQPSRLTKVLIFPKSGGWTMAGLGEMAENRSADPAKQTMAIKEMLNLDQEGLMEVLQGLAQNRMDRGKQFYDALEKIQELDVFREMTKFEDDGFQGFSKDGAEVIKEIKKALEGIWGGTTGIKLRKGGEKE